MTTAHLIHGFNVWDRGRGTTDLLRPYLEAAGYNVVEHDYGWVFLLGLRRRTDRVVEEVLEQVEPGDVLVGHSHAAWIKYRVAARGAPLGAVVCIQGALRRDTRWPEHLPVLCLYNQEDWIVDLGRVWGRFASVVNPWRGRHGWGAAGRYGFTAGQPLVDNWDTQSGRHPVTGHSGLFRLQDGTFNHWASKINGWLTSHAKPRS